MIRIMRLDAIFEVESKAFNLERVAMDFLSSMSYIGKPKNKQYDIKRTSDSRKYEVYIKCDFELKVPESMSEQDVVVEFFEAFHYDGEATQMDYSFVA